MEMTREQMIAWLTLEGWEPVIISDRRYVVNKEKELYTIYACVYPCKYHGSAGANALAAKNVGWGAWTDEYIRRAMEAASAYS